MKLLPSNGCSVVACFETTAQQQVYVTAYSIACSESAATFDFWNFFIYVCVCVFFCYWMT
jgi:hypothetical protein